MRGSAGDGDAAAGAAASAAPEARADIRAEADIGAGAVAIAGTERVESETDVKSAADADPDEDGAASPGRRGRRPGSGDTRGRILEAARAAFAERGFDGATIREIAQRAVVDPALVHHYFGTKQRLFIAALTLPVDFSTVFREIGAGPPGETGERIVRTFLGVWDRPELQPTLLGVLRSAATDDMAAELLAGVMVEGPFQGAAALVRTPDARLRALLVGSQLIGLAMARYVLRIEPAVSMPPDEMAGLIGPALTRYLLGDLS